MTSPSLLMLTQERLVQEILHLPPVLLEQIVQITRQKLKKDIWKEITSDVSKTILKAPEDIQEEILGTCIKTIVEDLSMEIMNFTRGRDVAVISYLHSRYLS